MTGQADVVPTPKLPVETDRLTLRLIDPQRDVEDVYAYQRLEEFARYVRYEPQRREDMDERITRLSKNSTIEKEGDTLGLAVVVRASGRMIGDVNISHRSDEHRCGEIGYGINPEFGGRGYATEACRALLKIAFDDLGLHRVIGVIDERNEASARVLLRIGMREEARLVEDEWFKGEWSTTKIFAILDSEWRAANCGLSPTGPPASH